MDVPSEPTTVPLGLANFADDLQSIRPFAERARECIVPWSVFNRGDHHALLTAPDLLVDDVRKFFRRPRSRQMSAEVDYKFALKSACRTA